MQHQSMWLSQVDPDLQTKHHHLPWAEFGDHSPGKTTPVLQVSKPQSELENLFNTFINKIRTAQKYRLGWSKELSFSQAALMSLRAVTVSRTYFLYLSFSHTSVLWHLSWPTLLIRRSSGIFTRPCLVGLQVPQPCVGDGHHCHHCSPPVTGTGSLWLPDEETSLQGPSSTLEVQPGRGQGETKCWMLLTIKWRGQQLCKSAGCQGALRAPGQYAGLLSKHWGSACGCWEGRVLFQGATGGIWTVPWVTRLKLVQPKWRGLVLESCPGADGSLRRLSLGTGWSITSWAAVVLSGLLCQNSHPQVGQSFGTRARNSTMSL